MAIPLDVCREHDIRGLFATELTFEFSEQLIRGFGRGLIEDDPAAQTLGSGCDRRRSS